jgi:hypothetical protein
MGLFDRIRPRTVRGQVAARAGRREQDDEARRHLEEFVRTRIGVEAFVEPATAVLPPTVLLIASSGEWTRRRVADPGVLRGLAERLRVPIYDVRLVGYPQRMRAWNERVKRGELPAEPPAPPQL